MVNKIFIVDDDEMLSMMLADHLQSNARYEIFTYATGEDCLKNLDKFPDLIILDFNLDSIEPYAANGLEVLQEIKRINNDIKVIMYSSQTQYGKALQTINKGAIEYVMKDNDAFQNIERIINRL